MVLTFSFKFLGYIFIYLWKVKPKKKFGDTLTQCMQYQIPFFLPSSPSVTVDFPALDQGKEKGNSMPPNLLYLLPGQEESLWSLLFWLPPVPHPSLTPTSRVCRSAWTLKRGSITSHSIDPGEPEVPKSWMGWEREQERRKKAVTWDQNCHHDTVQLQEANHLTSLFPHLTTGRPTDNH